MLFDNIYSAGITHDDRHDNCMMFIAQATAPLKVFKRPVLLKGP
jgi:hypothetical protein